MTAPTIDTSFIIDRLVESPKLHATETIGKTTYYIIKGNRPIAQRMVVLPATAKSQVSYEYAVWAAVRFKFLPDLLSWLEENRHWKDGGYISPK